MGCGWRSEAVRSTRRNRIRPVDASALRLDADRLSYAFYTASKSYSETHPAGECLLSANRVLKRLSQSRDERALKYGVEFYSRLLYGLAEYAAVHFGENELQLAAEYLAVGVPDHETRRMA
jgi:hypothetical protein